MGRIKNDKMFRRITCCLLSAAVCCSAGAAAAPAVNAAENEDSASIYKLADSCQEGTILHCFCWSYDDVKASLGRIASAGFTSIQLSPAQRSCFSGESKEDNRSCLYLCSIYRAKTNNPRQNSRPDNHPDGCSSLCPADLMQARQAFIDCY